MSATRKAYRAAILHSIADPAEVGLEASCEYYGDGLLVVDNATSHAHEMAATAMRVEHGECRTRFIVDQAARDDQDAAVTRVDGQQEWGV